MAKRAILSLLALGLLACGGGTSGGVSRSRVDLTNPFLGPDGSAWLVGPISRLATPEEIREFLALRDDAAAAAFVEQFWERRDPSPAEPGNPVRQAFEERSATADRRYGESGYSGRRTDRGLTYVLYGPPEKVGFEVAATPGASPIEVWTYGANAPSGLDGKRPAPFFRFTKRGELTVFVTGAPRSDLLTPMLEPD